MQNTQILPHNSSFESLKKLNEHGVEYWSARDLQSCLGYSKWHGFEPAIKKAMGSCKQSGNDPQNHFTSACNMVEIGSQTKREVNDYHLSRFACYLIAQNGDPRKPEIAHAQKYFAIQTRRQEISDRMAADLERIETREKKDGLMDEVDGIRKWTGNGRKWTAGEIRIFSAVHFRPFLSMPLLSILVH